MPTKVYSLTAERGSLPSQASGLGRIAHVVEGAGESFIFPLLGSWDERQTAPGGDDSLTGEVPWAVVRDHPAVFTDGAEIRTIHANSGRELWAGRLLEPQRTGGSALLTAIGYGHDPEESVVLWGFMDAGYDNWSPMNSDPYRIHMNAAYQLDNQGHLQISVPKGSEVPETARGGFAFSWPGGNAISKVEFTLDLDGDSSTWSNYDLRLLTYTFPATEISGPGGIYDFALADPGSHHYKKIADGADMIVLELRRKEGEGTTSTDHSLTVTLGDVHVFGTADNEDYTCSDMAMETGGRLGCETSRVASVTFPSVPFVVRDGTLEDPLNHAAMLSDSVWTITGSDRRLRFGRWEDVVWTANDPRAARQLFGLLRYDSVACPFRYGNRSVTDLLTLNAEDIDLIPLAKRRTYRIALDEPYPDESEASSIANSALQYLWKSRVGGSGTLATVRDPNGALTSAYFIEAGDCLDIEGNILRISEIRRTAVGVDWTADDSLAVLNRLVERRSHRIALGRT